MTTNVNRRGTGTKLQKSPPKTVNGDRGSKSLPVGNRKSTHNPPKTKSGS